MSDALDQHHIRAIEALNDRIRELEAQKAWLMDAIRQHRDSGPLDEEADMRLWSLLPEEDDREQ